MTCWFEISAPCSPKSSKMTPTIRPAIMPHTSKTTQDVSMMTLPSPMTV